MIVGKMPNLTLVLRKYAGTIIASIGMILLTIITYGDMGELFTDQYWENVGGNITSIGATSIGILLLQIAIKQGVGEQALSVGLNTADTKAKYTEHKSLILKNRHKYIYLPYFLSIRNERETTLKRREFISENGFKNEKQLFESKKRLLIRKYKHIKVNITISSIKWATTDIVYSKSGRIEKLSEYRRNRAIKSIFQGVIVMFATTLITGGLFLNPAEIPFWQKTVKLITYLFAIAVTVIPDISKNYEKGAFGVPNELDEINGIWREFECWQIPEWVKKEVEENSTIPCVDMQTEDAESKESKENEEVEAVEREETINTRTTLQEEPEKIEDI